MASPTPALIPAPSTVVALVRHTNVGGELYRQGAVIAVLPGKQTLERAFYGLRMAAHYVDLSSMLGIQVLSVRA